MTRGNQAFTGKNSLVLQTAQHGGNEIRQIFGEQAGTGGSAGVAYLRSTLFQPAFPDLWAIRARL